ncbi:transposase [Antrihabitans spumae]|uniref:Transposase n=1 Tax=Antrihabitans spumae TaxID=3373370 RepID=A0ABW7KEI3_9NOCA
MACPPAVNVSVLDNVLVAKGYRPVDRDQLFLQPPDMREWLPATDPVWLVIAAVAQLDTTAIHRTRRTGGVGRAGYDPDMLLTVLIWGWAHGQRSSRTLERLCSRDVAFRIICAGDAPDHATISRFRADSATAMESLYAQVLMLCAQLGMGNLGVVALDGVKIASNASMSTNRTKGGLDKAAAEQALADARALARKAAAAHAATDAAEDEMYGPDARDDVPADLVDPRSRAARIAEALAEMAKKSPTQIEREAKKSRKQARQQAAETKRAEQLDTYEHQREQRDGAPLGSPPTEIRVEVLTRNLEYARADQQAKIDRYNAGNGRGKAPVPVEQAYKVTRVKAALDRAIADREQRQLAESAAEHVAAQVSEKTPSPPAWLTEPKRNITDPQSRMMPLRGGGWLQGYNCQAVTSSDGLIIATSVGNNPNDATTFTTMLDKAVAAAALIATHRPSTVDEEEPAIGVLLADAGYLSEDNLTHKGPDRLIAVGKSRDAATAAREQPTEGPPPADATPLEAMAHRLRTPEGHALYKQRSHIAETPFGHAKHNLGFRRFSSRGITRASAEFAFHALVHNLFKAIRTNNLAAAT